MESVLTDFTTDLAQTVHHFRQERGLSVALLASISGVSRTMISKIEQAETQPTAALLGRLAAAFGVTLSELIGKAEQSPSRVRRLADQPWWSDPETGYRRRAVSPAMNTRLEIIEVELLAHTEFPAPAASYTGIDQQIWVQHGVLTFHEGDEVQVLEQGDCLQLGSPKDCRFVNNTAEICRYTVVLGKRFAERGLDS
jgi:transcriptional regulator with XRE-family HTH domain